MKLPFSPHPHPIANSQPAALRVMANKPRSPPLFGAASHPSASYRRPNSGLSLDSSSTVTPDSNAFVAWAKEPSPYRSLTPWVYYGSQPSPLTSGMTVPSPKTTNSSCIDYNYAPYSYPRASISAATSAWPSSQPSYTPLPDSYDMSNEIERTGPHAGSEYPVIGSTSASLLLDTFALSDRDTNSYPSSFIHLTSKDHGRTHSCNDDMTLRGERAIKLEDQDETASRIRDVLADTKIIVRRDITNAADIKNSVTQPQALLPRPASLVTLGSLDLESISESRALFYFGVLATQALLLPRFYLTKSPKSKKWSVKLTMYGTTFIRCHIYTSCRAAKVSVCREALKKFKAEYPDWAVPERPKDLAAPPEMDWVAILEDYCVHQGLPGPRYTKYVHPNGYRHEVEVDGGAYFGSLKHYAEELPSKQGAAHVALYDVLVRDDERRPEPQGLSSLKASGQSMLGLVPRDPSRNHNPPEQPAPPRRRLDGSFNSKGTRKRRRIGRSRSPSTFLSGLRDTPTNANLQPLKNCRLATIEAPVIEEARRWQVTPSDISRQIREIKTWTGKLDKTRNLLALEHPEIYIERIDGRLIDTDGEYTAAAYFKSDPFLARAGAIGKISGFFNSKNGAHEACAWKAYDYLIKMVKEDMVLEDKAVEEQKAITRWASDQFQ
ncbi:hypothetical protein BJX70DRAFT_161702 [Aspergillus crustosus]